MPWGLSAAGRSAGVLTLAMLLGFACASPTLPLPPPELPSQSAGPDADHIILSADCGGAEANAVILVTNLNPALRGDQAVSGAVASACGKWDAVVYAHFGDRLRIVQEEENVVSDAVTLQVR
jgi:hypothetical protein